MRFEDFMRLCPGAGITEPQAAACRFLESRGLRFCVDFGYSNAWAIILSSPEAEMGWVYL